MGASPCSLAQENRRASRNKRGGGSGARQCPHADPPLSTAPPPPPCRSAYRKMGLANLWLPTLRGVIERNITAVAAGQRNK